MPKISREEFVMKSYTILDWLVNFNEANFLKPIQKLRKKYGIKAPRRITHGLNKTKKALKEAVVPKHWIMKNDAFSYLIAKDYWDNKNKIGDFYKMIGEEKKQEFKNGINDILRKNNLGLEWFLTVESITINNYFFAPTRNLFIKDEGIPNRQSVELSLNPTTTLEDIKYIWHTIEKEKEKAFGKTKRVYTKKNYARDVELYLKFKNEKSINKKLTDLDVIGRLFPNEKDDSKKADIKRLNRLNQIIKRLEKGPYI